MHLKNNKLLTIIIVVHYRAQTPISVFDFYDAVPAGFNNIDNVEEFLEPWIKNTGYPLLHVAWRSANTIFLSQVC